MRKKALPIGVLFMVLVVLLAAVGISYGYWTEDIYADAEIDTGNLDVYWYSASTSISGPPGDADCSAEINTGDNNRLDVTLTDVHPGFKCTYTAKVYNNGTVPVNVTVGTGDIAYISGDPFDSEDFHMSIGPCNNPIYPGFAKACTGWFQLDWDADNDTQNLSSTYTVTVHATQLYSAP